MTEARPWSASFSFPMPKKNTQSSKLCTIEYAGACVCVCVRACVCAIGVHATCVWGACAMCMRVCVCAHRTRQALLADPLAGANRLSLRPFPRSADEPDFLYAAAYEGRNYDAIEVMEVSKVSGRPGRKPRRARKAPASMTRRSPHARTAVHHAARGRAQPVQPPAKVAQMRGWCSQA